MGRHALEAGRNERQPRRWLRTTALALGGLVVLGGVWIVVTALLARSQLQTVRSEVQRLHQQLAAGDMPAARRSAQSIADHASHAAFLTSGPAWAIGARLPGGGPLSDVRAIASGVDDLSSTALPGLIRASTQLAPESLRLPNGHIALSRISAAVPALDRASAQVRLVTEQIAAQPGQTWLGSVDDARSAILRQLTSLGGTLRSADLAAQVAPDMLGDHGVHRYFVAFGNEGQSAYTAALPRTFAILRAAHGEIWFERFLTDAYLGSTTPANSSVGGARFADAAQSWLSTWQRKTGQHLSGAIALDPTALSYLLRVTGPATLPGRLTVGAGNVVELSRNQGAKYLLTINRAASHRILHTTADVTGLFKAAGRAVGQRRLFVYSSDPATQALLARTTLTGAAPRR